MNTVSSLFGNAARAQNRVNAAIPDAAINDDHPIDAAVIRGRASDFIADAQRRLSGATAIGYIHITTPNGASEFVPLAKFDRLPVNPRYYIRGASRGTKPVFIRVPDNDPIPATPVVITTPATPATTPATPVVGPRFRRAVIKNRVRYIADDAGQYVRVGDGKRARYVVID